METEQKYRPAPPGFTPEQWETFNEDGIIFIEDAISDEDIDSYIDAIDQRRCQQSEIYARRLSRIGEHCRTRPSFYKFNRS